MAMPPLQLAASSRSGDISSMFGDMGAGMNVNFGNGVSQGGAAPVNPLLIVAALIAFYIYRK